MRSLVIAIAAGFAAGAAIADPTPPPPPPLMRGASADHAPPGAGWHSDHWGSDRTGGGRNGPGAHPENWAGGPPGEGWQRYEGGSWHRRSEWHGGNGHHDRWAGGSGSGDYAYRRFGRGGTVPRLWLGDQFYVRDWFAFGLGEPPYGYRWIRYYDDALLIAVADGRVYDAVPDVDWGRAYGAPGGSYGHGRGFHGGAGWGWGGPGGWSYGYADPGSVIVMTPVTTTTVTEDWVTTADHGVRVTKHRSSRRRRPAYRCSC